MQITYLRKPKISGSSLFPVALFRHSFHRYRADFEPAGVGKILCSFLNTALQSCQQNHAIQGEAQNCVMTCAGSGE